MQRPSTAQGGPRLQLYLFPGGETEARVIKDLPKVTQTKWWVQDSNLRLSDPKRPLIFPLPVRKSQGQIHTFLPPSQALAP